MDIAQLRTFLAAAESGSFAAAGEMVHASASSVTERIAALEHRIGARLFERSRKGCELTDAGKRFLPRARSIASIWDMSKAEARVPARFTAQARIGGQYALWPDFLLPWIAALQEQQPQLALSLTAGASARLNRDLAGEVLDLAIVYSPTIGPGIMSRPVLNDRLVLVRAATCADWCEGWVDIDWGEQMRAPIAEAVGDMEQSGVRLDLGSISLRWLVERNGAGYLPERLARPALASGSILPVPGKPSFDYPAHALWRSRSDFDAEPVVQSLVDFVAATGALLAPA
ncbi:LysR family transcriptional regulator [Alteraurantiacibacter aquimixticola]|uniref:LysR family transcriptional regulator n=1 Tax=Alteraurantiacibacter aquimixticola TaxID=2489173 RepID=A0A4T3F3N1_9SPHN|nr:LysR family transcriptional regulator [Alteraurantiacibacter aquimixticola]TIX49260.1 LysR family transcriptional regulator [Alteraurantiacibacter aquimixticola]